jgi:hypothetical protein
VSHGWRLPAGAPPIRAHYFGPDGASLCGRWVRPRILVFYGTEGPPASLRCTTCVRMSATTSPRSRLGKILGRK